MRITAALKSEIVPYKETAKVVRCLAIPDGSLQMMEIEVAEKEDIKVGDMIRVDNREERYPWRVFMAKVISIARREVNPTCKDCLQVGVSDNIETKEMNQ